MENHTSATRAAQKLIFERLNYQGKFLEKDPFDKKVTEFATVWAPIGKLIKGAERSSVKLDRIADELNTALEVVQLVASRSEEAIRRRDGPGSRILETSSSAFSQEIEKGWGEFWREVALDQVRDMVEAKVKGCNNDFGNELIDQVARLNEATTTNAKRTTTLEGMQAKNAGE